MLFLWILKQTGAGAGGTVLMAEELNRITLENKKLTEMLTVLCENYNALETHVKELMTNKQLPSENELTISSGNTCSLLHKKRKSPGNDHQDYCNNVNMIGFSTNTISTAETSSSDEESYKRPKEMMSDINLKISRVYVRCDVSDMRLVRNWTTPKHNYVHQFMFLITFGNHRSVPLIKNLDLLKIFACLIL